MLTSYFSQVKNATPYGKFAHGTKLNIRVSGRLGMLLIYSPAFFWVGVTMAQGDLLSSLSALNSVMASRLALVKMMLILHFSKRILETLFVHKFSGSSDGVVDTIIGAYYALTCWIITTFIQESVSAEILSPYMLVTGIILFAVGEFGNGYHHLLLANLRKDKQNDQKYIAPTGGLFGQVAMPHYFFELIAWLGIACAAQHANGFLVVLTMTSYLSGRAKATNQWNTANIPGYTSRKNIFPGLF